MGIVQLLICISSECCWHLTRSFISRCYTWSVRTRCDFVTPSLEVMFSNLFAPLGFDPEDYGAYPFNRTHINNKRSKHQKLFDVSRFRFDHSRVCLSRMHWFYSFRVVGASGLWYYHICLEFDLAHYQHLTSSRKFLDGHGPFFQ